MPRAGPGPHVVLALGGGVALAAEAGYDLRPSTGWLFAEAAAALVALV